ncbi:hypothetical protein JL722_9342 [Aureococcus anophagefferens]|nr:hypothetical protein JL722_9342 [Aureococcus anophagefferens]
MIIHGLAGLKGAEELSPGLGIYKGGSAEAAQRVQDESNDPYDFRFFIGKRPVGAGELERDIRRPLPARGLQPRQSRPMGARYLLALATASAVDVAYFRDDPAAKTQLQVTDEGAAWLQSHDTTIEIFDSPKPAGGAARFDVYIDKAGASMLFFVSSGPLDFAAGRRPAPPRVVAGRDALAASATPYRLTGNCSDGAIHPELPADYSNLDEPIGPLAAHYHTPRRVVGAFTLRGSGLYVNVGRSIAFETHQDAALYF